MEMNMPRLRRIGAALSGAALLSLAACGGGGGGSSPTPAVTTASVPVTVVDGPIKNALVCLDKNKNGACDSGEPSGRTDGSGNITLQVPAEDAGKYPILAVVGTDAVDTDTGAVPTPFVLKAPADKPNVVSPLTTLVQALVESTGASSTSAASSLQSTLGLNVSLFEDFTKNGSADGKTAGTVARMVVVTTQQQSKALASAVGTKNPIDGGTISQKDLDKAIQQKLLQILSDLVTKLADPSVKAAQNPTDLSAALTTLAQALVNDATTGLTTTTVATIVAINNQTASGSGSTNEAPSASVQLVSMNFYDSLNWSWRALTSTAGQNTPDSSNRTRYVDRRSSSNFGAVANWGFGGQPNRQSDLHWNGTSWVNCAPNYENLSTVRDAAGNSNYDICDKFEIGSSNRASFDIGGRTMLDVMQQLYNGGYTNLYIAGADSLLGSTAFPTGAKLFYHTTSALNTALAYYPGLSSVVRNANAAVAAGKTSASDNTSACASITPSTPQGSYTTAATTLESMIAANPGTPCVYGPGTLVVSAPAGGTTTVSSGARNEWWSQSSVSLGVLGNAPTGGYQTAHYTTNTLLRAAFAAGNVVKYYSCQQRSTDGSSRNCDPIGTGTYTITTLGDARVMTLGTPPTLTGGLNYQRIFVQRGGSVYLGYQNKPVVNRSARLNLQASNALLTKLGLPAVDPATPISLTPASYAGDWIVNDSSDSGGLQVTTGTTLRLNPNFVSGNASTTACIDNSTNIYESCTITLNGTTGAFTLTDASGSGSGTFNFLSGAVSGTYTPTGGSAMTITGMRR